MIDALQSKKTLFLDRDGVININHGYVYQKQDFEFIDGIFTLCKHAQSKGYQIIIVTNQSGIARQYYSEKKFKQLSKWVEHQFWKKGISIKQTLHCPHHPKITYSCACRKPNIGMIIKAQRRFKVDLAKAIMVGDSLSDMKCAQRAKIGKRILFRAKPIPHNQIPHQPKLKRALLQKPASKGYYEVQDLHTICSLLT